MDDFEQAVERVITSMAPDFQESVRADIGVLRDRGVSSWPELVAVLSDQSAGQDRAIACWLLARIGGEPAFAPLVVALHNPDPLLRAEAARALGVLDNPQAVPELITALRTDPDADTSIAAAHSLGLLGDHRAVDPLLAVLADPSADPRLRGFAAEALIGPGERRAVPPLIAALADPSAEVRYWAAFALGQLADPAALDALERLAQTDEAIVPGCGSVKEEAAAAIKSIRARRLPLPGYTACRPGRYN